MIKTKQLNRILNAFMRALFLVIGVGFSVSVVSKEEFNAVGHYTLTSSNQSIKANQSNFLYNNDNLYPQNIFQLYNTDSYVLSDLNLTSSPIFNLSDQSSEGSWLVSFGLQDSKNSILDSKYRDLQVAAEYNSSSNTSQFFVNYGNKKIPISISFDEGFFAENALQQNNLSVGYQKKFNESWAVSINYLESEWDIAPSLGVGSPRLPLLANTDNRTEYLFNVGQKSQLGTINLDPLYNTYAQLGRNIGGIEIKVSRKLTDNFMLSGGINVSEGENRISPLIASNHDLFKKNHLIESFKQDVLSLEGNYQLADNWQLAAQFEHKREAIEYNEGSNLGTFDSTTLDIGLKYQTKFDHIGLIIRVDLTNLLGFNELNMGEASPYGLSLDERGLVPYTFQSPKYIKLSGSINF